MKPRGPILLLVEDDDNDVFFFRRALEKAGLDVAWHLASDGEQALQYLSGNGKFADRTAYPLPNLIFLDLKLPYLNGLEILEYMQKQPALAEIDVIVLTSSSEERDRKRAFELGAKKYLVKPATPRTLLEILGTSRLREEARL
jgi:CheY-like chemotaxis protein